VIDPDRVKRVLVVGSGMMGSSIAQVFAAGDLEVTLVDVNEKALTRAMGVIESGLKTLADFGRLSETEIPSILSRIRPVTGSGRDGRRCGLRHRSGTGSPSHKKEGFLTVGGTLCSPNGDRQQHIGPGCLQHRGDQGTGASHHHPFFAPGPHHSLVEIVPGPGLQPEPCRSPRPSWRSLERVR